MGLQTIAASISEEPDTVMDVVEPYLLQLGFIDRTQSSSKLFTWIKKVGRNLTDPVDGFLSNKKFLIVDRDSKYSLAFRTLMNGSGVEIVRLPPRSPNLNAYAERFVRSIKDECLSRMILFGERSLRKATREYAAHYHRERNHQGIENRLIESDDRPRSAASAIECSSRLGGMLRFYHRVAA